MLLYCYSIGSSYSKFEPFHTWQEPIVFVCGDEAWSTHSKIPDSATQHGKGRTKLNRAIVVSVPCNSILYFCGSKGDFLNCVKENRQKIEHIFDS